MTRQTQMTQVLETNRYTEKFGLSLSREDAELLAESRADALRREQRVEFGAGILPKIIETFCDSAYLMQENYCDALSRLQDIFYLYKNEMLDEITDDELLEFMSPILKDFGDASGIDRVLEYMTCIFVEQRFLGKFGKAYVTEILRAYDDDYGDLTENICEIVLQNTIGHLLSDKPLDSRGFDRAELENVEKILRGGETGRSACA